MRDSTLGRTRLNAGQVSKALVPDSCSTFCVLVQRRVVSERRSYTTFKRSDVPENNINKEEAKHKVFVDPAQFCAMRYIIDARYLTAGNYVEIRSLNKPWRIICSSCKGVLIKH